MFSIFEDSHSGISLVQFLLQGLNPDAALNQLTVNSKFKIALTSR